MANNNPFKSKILVLTVVIAIAIVIAIPVSTTFVFNNVFSLNYSKTPLVNLEDFEEVFDLQNLENVSDSEIVSLEEIAEPIQPIVVDELETLPEVTIENIIEEQPEDIFANQTNLIENQTEIVVANQTEITITNQTDSVVENQTGSSSSGDSGLAYVISQTDSGFILTDSLMGETLEDYWSPGGNAESLQAHHYHFTDDEGLHIGIQAPEFGVYAGYNLVSPPSNGTLFHAKITAPTLYIPNGFLQNGLYVQSSLDPFNFVSCQVTSSSTGKLSWGITQTYFDEEGNSQYKVLWSGPNPTPTKTSECTIITNGDNHLRVLLDRNEVYENDKLDLQMKKPLRAYLEAQSSYAGQQLYGIYEDFYITSGDSVSVVNLPHYIGQVILTDETDALITSAEVIDGTAKIDVGNFHLPFTASIHAVNNQQRFISTQEPVILFGGDVFMVEIPNQQSNE